MSNIKSKYINIMIIPTNYCNMNCLYCFNSRCTDHKDIMSRDVLKKIYDITLPRFESVNFLWHGGEPLAAGKEFYEYAFELQENYKELPVRIRNSIQTNLTLMSEEMASFLIDHNVYLGSSFDGINSNERTRHNTDQILRGYEIYSKQGGRAGFIYVVQSYNINDLIDDYEWFKSKGINYTIHQYMAPYKENDILYVPPERYAEKVCQLFDTWFFDRNCNINISYFEMLINYIVYHKKQLCSTNSCIGKHIGIYPNGDIYNCNRDFPREYCFGNVNDYEDIRECFDSPGFQNLLEAAFIRREKCRDKCEFFHFCAGGCNSDALMGGSISDANKDVCIGLKMIYRYICDIMKLWKTKSLEEIHNNINPRISSVIISYKRCQTEE